MIDEVYFLKQIKKASDLNGHMTKRETSEEIYNRLKHHDDRDFDAAIDSIVEEGEKITYRVLKARLGYQRWRRRNREERIEWQRMMDKGESSPNVHTQPGMRRMPGCALCCYGNRSLQNIWDIVNKRKTFNQVCREMSEEFPGCGLGTYIAEEVF